MVMQRLANNQYAAGAGAGFYANTGGGPSVSGGLQVDTGSARWTGITVVVALALVWIGYHGLKG